MKDTLLFILKQIVDHPDDVNILETVSENKTLLTINANPQDIGQIIGKHGRIIKAIRDLIKILAVKHNTYIDVILTESQEPGETSHLPALLGKALQAGESRVMSQEYTDKST